MIIRAGSMRERWRFAGRRRSYRIFGRIKTLSWQVSAVLPAPSFYAPKGESSALRARLSQAYEMLGGYPAVVHLAASSKLSTAVVEVWSRRVIKGYVKLAFTPEASMRLTHEAEMSRLVPPGLAPRIVDEFRASEVVGMISEPVLGRSPRIGSPDRRACEKFVRALESDESLDVDHLTSRLRLLPSLSGLLADHVLALRNTDISGGVQHGDFVPWNVVVNRRGDFTCLDWEFGQANGVPILDAAFWLLQSQLVANSRSARRTIGEAVRWLVRGPWPNLGRQEALAIVGFAAAQAILRDRNQESFHRRDEAIRAWRFEVLRFTAAELRSCKTPMAPR
jgi:hypothetical protein